jgi:ABC-type lipoprotein export system ATPase subunit
MSERVLKITSLSKTFRYNGFSVPVIENLDLTVDSGEIICIFGRSGSGKTTLLNLTGGLDTPDSGEIILNGINVTGLKEREMARFRRENVGFVFQHFNLVPYLTALENVELPLKYDGIPQLERRRKAQEVLESLGLGDRLNFRMSSLSGGQIQRVTFARAAVMNPAVILADEPTGQLDSETALELADIIRTMNRKDNLTFILATHDPVLSSISDRVLMMNSGRLTEKSCEAVI